MGEQQQFVHLHNHTAYSLLDGMSDIDQLYAKTAEMGMPAAAITDHGHMMGTYTAYKAAKKHGVKPIIGVEGYGVPGTAHRSEKQPILFGQGGNDDVSARGAYTHMTLLAETTEGMHNLFKMVSLASIEGYYYKPRIDRELLQTYSRGVIATSGCPSGEIQTRLRLGQWEEAVQAASDFKDIFGEGNFFVELMDHGLDIETRVKDDLLRIAKTLNLPLLGTNDLHYINKEDAKHHEAMLCVQSRSKLSDPDRFKFDGDTYYLRPPEEMYQVFNGVEEACTNTLLVAERCDVEFTEHADLMPVFPVPEGETLDSWLKKEVHAGLKKRLGSKLTDVHTQQADYELGVISHMGYSGYFLVVSDFIMWAKNNGIRVGPGRGSAAGSIVAYATGITEVDPIEHKLLFERFLNPSRVTMPDIDIDFDDERRGEVIQYVTDKYGHDKVCQIVTFGVEKAKAAVKDSARIHGADFQTSNNLTKLYPDPVTGRDMPLKDVFDPTAERYPEAADFRDAAKKDPQIAAIVETARGIEGVIRQTGVHAAGIIISKEPLLDVLPIQMRQDDESIITQYEQKICETFGLLKMDFLGLRNLTIISNALNLIKQNRGIDVDLDNLPLDDPETFALLGRGETLGVFQLDGGPMRQLLKSMVPDSFADISAVLALYRPGPMGANAHNDYADRKNKRKPIIPIHPELKEALAPILEETYSVIVYQEQIMEIAQKLAGYTLGQADNFRRAMGKKDAKALEAEKEGFYKGMREHGYPDDAIDALWDTILPFSDYAFNKSHTVAYGLIAYQTAWLKAHYPVEYMSALLTSVADNKDKAAIYLNECHRMGITLLPPDINISGSSYTPAGEDTIRIGFGAIRNVGEKPIAEIIEVREATGPYVDFNDFLTRIDFSKVNKRAIDSLIKAGAFDGIHPGKRAALSEVHATAVDAIRKYNKKKVNKNQSSLFDENPDEDTTTPQLFHIPDTPEWPKTELLGHERTMIGQYVSDHPLRGVSASLADHADERIKELFPSEGGPKHGNTPKTLAGAIVAITNKRTKKGDAYVIATVEDLTGAVDVTVFPSTYEKTRHLWYLDEIVSIKVRPDMRDDGSYQLLASTAKHVTVKPDPEGWTPPPLDEPEETPKPAAVTQPEEEPSTPKQPGFVPDYINQRFKKTQRPQQTPTNTQPNPPQTTETGTTMPPSSPTNTQPAPKNPTQLPPPPIMPHTNVIAIHIPNIKHLTPQYINNVKTILAANPGNTPIILYITNPNIKKTTITVAEATVTPTTNLLKKLKALLDDTQYDVRMEKGIRK